MPPTNKQPNNVLVAMITDRHDYARLQDECWYRIPIDTAPPFVILKGTGKERPKSSPSIRPQS